ncbi:TniQ family protein [Janthinobacterium sp. RT4P48]|uniref:TniQ family protein n=1 Tax=Janthinobacterium sp. RT4P48 TaxID=3424188 RepID=UPI003F23F83A
MATSNTRHKGVGGLAARWPVPVRLEPDELFSTWLIRVSFAQGCDPLILAGQIWPKWRAWTIDLDRRIGIDQMAMLARMSGIEVAALEAATLRPIAKAIGTIPSEAAILPWVLALGSRNRRRCGGLQYCPMCFHADRLPYYRRHWRLAWHICCSKHGVLLLDRCHRCGAVPEPHRLLLPQSILSTCSSCGNDLRTSPAACASSTAIAFQQRADDVVKYGYGEFTNILLSAPDWFALSRYFLMLVRTATRYQSSKLANWLTKLGIEVANMQCAATGLGFELLPVNERALILSAVNRLLSTTPKRLLEVAEASGLAATTLRQGRRDLPISMCDVIDWLPQRKRSARAKANDSKNMPLSRASVMRKWARLQRKMGRMI